MLESDAKTLRAVLAALSELNVPLEPDTQVQLNQISQSLERDPETAIQRLREVALASPQLKPSYEEIRTQLQSDYQAKHRNKVIEVTIKGNDSQTETLETENLSLSLDAIKISVAILGSQAPEQMAKDIKEQVQVQAPPESPSPLPPWTRYLQF